MNILKRATEICLSPKTEWPVIAAERSTRSSLLLGYYLPLNALLGVAWLIHHRLERSDPLLEQFRMAAGDVLGPAVVGLGLSLGGALVFSLILNELAPRFGGEKNPEQALKVVVYATTAAFVGGYLAFVPVIGSMLDVAGALFSFYLLYLGLPVLMKCPKPRAAGYALLLALCSFAIYLTIMGVAYLYFFAGRSSPT